MTKRPAADRSRARATGKRPGSRTPKPRKSPAAARDAQQRDHGTPNEFKAWQASLTPRERRVAEVLQLMQAGEWNAGSSHRRLAQKWGVHPGTVEHVAAEANRALRLMFRNDPDARADALLEILTTFRTVRLRMLANGSVAAARVALDAAEAFGRYNGIEPPKNVKLSTQDEFEHLTDEQLELVANEGVEALRGPVN